MAKLLLTDAERKEKLKIFKLGAKVRIYSPCYKSNSPFTDGVLISKPGLKQYDESFYHPFQQYGIVARVDPKENFYQNGQNWIWSDIRYCELRN